MDAVPEGERHRHTHRSHAAVPPGRTHIRIHIADVAIFALDIYTVTGSLAGIPGISVPCGNTKARLPVGMQILGPHFSEGRVLQIARAFEKAGGFEI